MKELPSGTQIEETPDSQVERRAHEAIQLLRSRRITKRFTIRPIVRDSLETIVEMARWAPSAGNRRLQRFVVVQEHASIGRIRAFSPGIDSSPAAIIVICTDWSRAREEGIPDSSSRPWIDVGAAAQNMLLAAHALGIGAGPVTSFSQEAVRVLLNLPGWLEPNLLICLGHIDTSAPRTKIRAATRLRWQDLVYWERYVQKQD